MRSSDALTDPSERFPTLANEHMTMSPSPSLPLPYCVYVSVRRNGI